MCGALCPHRIVRGEENFYSSGSQLLLDMKHLSTVHDRGSWIQPVTHAHVFA